MLGIVLPVVTNVVDVVDVDGPVHIDGVAAPVDSAAPIIAARRPAAQRITGAKRKSCGKQPIAEVGRRREIVWRGGRVGASALNNSGGIIKEGEHITVRRAADGPPPR